MQQSTRRLVGLLITASSLTLAPGCELATHFGDFQQGGGDTGTDGGSVRPDGGDGGDDGGSDSGLDGGPGPDTGVDGGGGNDAGRDADVPHHTVTVTLSGAGMATLRSSDTTFSCSSSMSPCTWSVPEGSLTVDSMPDATSALQSWDGACSSTATSATSCTVDVSADLALGATYRVRQVALDVGVSGLGTVSSTSPPSLGIDCTGGSTGCAAVVAAGTSVTLHAAAGSGYTFAGWTIAGCTGTGDCTFTITDNTHVDATFTDGRVPVRVALGGDGTGSVASDVGAISCGTTCSDLYLAGAHVVLTATTATGSTFTSWTNCPTTPTANVCAFDVPASGTMLPVITATFSVQRFTLTVHRAGAGGGMITSASPTIACGAGAGCVATGIAYGTVVTLSEAPAADSVFAGWTGVSGCSSGTSCMVTITGATSVTGTFNLQTVHVTFAGGGAGSGTFTTDDGVVTTCTSTAGTTSGTCTADYPIHTAVTVRGNAGTGSQFGSWSSTPGGYCSGAMTSCSFTAEEDMTITGTFALRRYDLGVTVTGTTAGGMTGSGSVGFSTGGVTTCASAAAPGNTCMNNYAYNQMVTLTATATGGSVFTGWGGDCFSQGTMTTCTVTMLAARNVTASFGPNTASLNVSTTGLGSVTDGGGLITCPSGACSATVTNGTVVTLTATPNAGAGYTFSGWTGACASYGTSPTCMVTISGPTNVGANFALGNRTVTVSIGSPSGTVTDGGGMACSTGSCVQSYPYNSMVTLTATPATGYTFAGWAPTSGCTSVSGNTCTINPLTANTTVTANFAVQMVTVSVSFTGSGIGLVSGSSFSCHSQPTAGDTCSRSVAYGTTLSLVATPQSGSVFGGWSGACSGASCSFTATSSTPSVTASFTLQQYQFTVTDSPSTGGTVTAQMPVNINCGAQCSTLVDYNTLVRLTATPNVGYRFGSWSVASCGLAPTCDVLVTSMTSVTATFIPIRTVTVTIPGTSTYVRSANVSSLNVSGMNCTNTTGTTAVSCSVDFDVGTSITLGSSDPMYRYFGVTSWSFSGTGASTLMCGASAAACTFTVPAGADRLSVTANFGQLGNLAFVTSTTYNGGTSLFSNATSYCQGRAMAAGLPGVSSYIAFLSNSSNPMTARLPASASVFIRPDGRPVGTRTQLFNGSLTFPIVLDEAGAPVISTTSPNTTGVWTGTTSSGATAGSTCSDWSSFSTNGMTGLTTATTNPWTNNVALPCGNTYHLFCLETDISTTVVPQPLLPSDPVYIWTSSHTGTGATTVIQMDAYCQQEAMANGLNDTYVALVSYSSTTAFSRAALYGTLTRPDGWAIGPHTSTNSVLWSPTMPMTGTWGIQADRTLLGGNPVTVWNGMGANATGIGATCVDWTGAGSTQSGASGYSTSVAPGAFAGFANISCNTVQRWYCIQNGLTM